MKKNDGIKKRIDAVLSQHLIAKGKVDKPLLPDYVLQGITLNIATLRKRKVGAKHKLKLIQHTLNALHLHTEKITSHDHLLWRRAWCFEILCKELTRLPLAGHSKSTYLFLPIEVYCPQKGFKPVMLRHLFIPKQKLWASSKKFLNYGLLLPKDKTYSLPPIALFPGTDFKKLSSIMASGDLKGPGKSLYEACKEAWVRLCKSLPGLRLMGYSQGAAMVHRACLQFPESLCQDPLSPHLSFNAPGIDDDLFEKNLLSGFQVPLIQFSTYADPVSKIGKLLPEVYEINSNNHRDSGYPWRHHIGCKSYTTQAQISKINIQLENLCRLRKGYQVFISLLSRYKDRINQLKSSPLLSVIKKALLTKR